jgi:hypothetical protein
MPCEVVLLRVDFFKMAAVAMETDHPIPIVFDLSRSTSCGCSSYQVSSISVWQVTCYDHFLRFSRNEISQKNRNQLDKLCRSCHRNKKGGIKQKF